MRDIIITQRRIRTELIIVALCFAIAFIANVVAVFIYKSPLTEIYSSIFYVLTAALVLYVLSVIVRVIIALIGDLMHKLKQ
jgi:hypothetical protein